MQPFFSLPQLHGKVSLRPFNLVEEHHVGLLEVPCIRGGENQVRILFMGWAGSDPVMAKPFRYLSIIIVMCVYKKYKKVM